MPCGQHYPRTHVVAGEMQSYVVKLTIMCQTCLKYILFATFEGWSRKHCGRLRWTETFFFYLLLRKGIKWNLNVTLLFTCYFCDLHPFFSSLFPSFSHFLPSFVSLCVSLSAYSLCLKSLFLLLPLLPQSVSTFVLYINNLNWEEVWLYFSERSQHYLSLGGRHCFKILFQSIPCNCCIIFNIIQVLIRFSIISICKLNA